VASAQRGPKGIEEATVTPRREECMLWPKTVVENGVLVAKGRKVGRVGESVKLSQSLVLRAARGLPREMWERVQKPLLQVLFSATVPQVLKFYL
jgi:hypothetical protein